MGKRAAAFAEGQAGRLRYGLAAVQVVSQAARLLRAVCRSAHDAATNQLKVFLGELGYE